MPRVPVGFNIAHVLFVCRQLAPETGTGYWYQKTGQCVWPLTHVKNLANIWQILNTKTNLHDKRKREQINHNSTKSNCRYDKQGLHLHSQKNLTIFVNSTATNSDWERTCWLIGQKQITCSSVWTALSAPQEHSLLSLGIRLHPPFKLVLVSLTVSCVIVIFCNFFLIFHCLFFHMCLFIV